MAKKKGGNPAPKLPASRGIPAAESLWMPKHYGVDIKNKGGVDKAARWDLADVVDFVFPGKYQPTYHGVACDFLSLILEKGQIDKKDISKFLKEKGHSRSTLQNKIIPKLVSMGLLKREREIKAKMKKGRALLLSESLTFTNYLDKIGFEWNSLVTTARNKRKVQESTHASAP